MSNKVYDVLKAIEMIVIPAIGVFYNTIAHIWGLEAVMHPVQVNETVGAIATLLGVILLVSSGQYKKAQELANGTDSTHEHNRRHKPKTDEPSDEVQA